METAIDYAVPRIMLRTSQRLFYLALTAVYGVAIIIPHFTDENTKVQGGSVTCPRPHSLPEGEMI